MKKLEGENQSKNAVELSRQNYKKILRNPINGIIHFGIESKLLLRHFQPVKCLSRLPRKEE